MPPKILELIDKVDNVEVVRDQIAAILAVELAHQTTLGAELMPRVFLERANPWGEFIDAVPAQAPIINVWFDSANYDGAASNIVERQKADAIYNIDCYGCGVAVEAGAGHTPADIAAALEAQRAARLVRNILMAGVYTYLGLRGVVWKRWPQALTMFQPQIDNRATPRIVAGRLAFAVQFNEFSPQYEGEELEGISIEVMRAETGELYLRADYPPAEE